MGYLIELDLPPALNPRSYGGNVQVIPPCLIVGNLVLLSHLEFRFLDLSHKCLTIYDVFLMAMVDDEFIVPYIRYVHTIMYIDI